MDGEEILFDGAAMTWADPGGWVLSSLSQKIDLAGGNTYFPASSTPPTAGKVGDFWFDTSAGVLKRWDGTAWIGDGPDKRSEEHTSELQSLMRISYAVFCLKKKIHTMN